jgi:BarA-like signal transduction histidine kinase
MKNACYNKIRIYKNKTMHQMTSQILLEKVIIIVFSYMIIVLLHVYPVMLLVSVTVMFSIDILA